LNYLQMLNNDVILQLQQHFQMQKGGAFWDLWWVQDGAPAHRVIAVRDRLRELFGHRVIALYHGVEWPPRSPNPCDFFLWGYLKNKVYTGSPLDLNDLQNRIRDEVHALQNNPAIIRRAVHAMLQRCQLCMERRWSRRKRGSIIFNKSSYVLNVNNCQQRQFWHIRD
jgi:hypothetical protein